MDTNMVDFKVEFFGDVGKAISLIEGKLEAFKKEQFAKCDREEFSVVYGKLSQLSAVSVFYSAVYRITRYLAQPSQTVRIWIMFKENKEIEMGARNDTGHFIGATWREKAGDNLPGFTTHT